MASEIQICNMALDELDVAAIQSFTEATKQARVCKRHYEQTRDLLLSKYDWGFARKTATLALLTEEYDGWDFAYQSPSDCLVPRKIWDSITATAYNLKFYPEVYSNYKGVKVPFEIRVNSDGSSKVILTNQEDAVLIYTARITDVNAFDVNFIEALYLKLASKMAYPLRKDPNKAKQLLQEHMIAIGEAGVIDANSEQVDEDEQGYVEARQ